MQVFGLILSFSGAIGGVLWLVEKWKIYVQDRRIRRLFPSQNELLVVMSSQGERSGPNVVTTVEDSRALAAIQTTLVRYGMAYRVKLHTEITEDDRRGDMFGIGGTSSNSIHAAVNSLHLLPFHFEKNSPGGGHIMVDAAGNPVCGDIRPGETDCAIVGVLTNPWSLPTKRARIYIAAGLEGLAHGQPQSSYLSAPINYALS